MTNNKLVLVVAVIVAFVVGLGAGIFVGPRVFFAMHPSQLPGQGGNLNSGNSTQTVGTLFSSFQYAPYSYLISGNATLSASGKIATGDFNLTTIVLQNASTKYSMKFDEIGTVYNVTVGHGSKLYYIDTNLADDMHGADASFGDDGYAVVNSTGYVVAYKYPLPST